MSCSEKDIEHWGIQRWLYRTLRFWEMDTEHWGVERWSKNIEVLIDGHRTQRYWEMDKRWGIEIWKIEVLRDGQMFRYWEVGKHFRYWDMDKWGFNKWKNIEVLTDQQTLRYWDMEKCWDVERWTNTGLLRAGQNVEALKGGQTLRHWEMQV